MTDRLDGSARAALAAMALAVFIISNDMTSLTVALPRIERDLGTDVTTAQWVLNSYTLVFGVLIVTGGRLADMFGRRRVFFAGIAIFSLFSVTAAIAPDAQVLIASRALMAIGGAMIWPAVVGMIFATVPADRPGLAGALILGVGGIGNAFGPLIGGGLTDGLDWRWILVLNLPIAAIAYLVIRAKVAPDGPPEAGRRIDRAGIAAISVTTLCLLLALDQSSDWGWGDPRVLGLLAISVIGLVALVISQRDGDESSLLPRDVMSNTGFRFACASTFLATGAFFALLLFMPQFMQKVLGFTALGSGAGFLPLMLTFSATAFAGAPLYNRLGPAPLLVGGALLLAIGSGLISLAGADSPYGALVPGMVVFGAGVGFFYSTLTTAAISSLDPSRSSLGGGILYMFQLVGGAIGLGISTAVFTSVSSDAAGTAVEAVAEGVQASLRVEALFALAAAVTAYFVTRAMKREGAAGPAAGEPAAESATGGTSPPPGSSPP